MSIDYASKSLNEASLEELELAIAIKKSALSSKQDLAKSFEEELLTKYKTNYSAFISEYEIHNKNYYEFCGEMLKRLAEVSEKYGIPCHFLDQYYVPMSFHTLFSNNGEIPEAILDIVNMNISPEQSGEWWTPSISY